ncbi:MAG: hypothetical protein CL476_07735 [Acidobacteria bacterium]|nr:hypothetical protein [Acidobacteriota bacterium]
MTMFVYAVLIAFQIWAIVDCLRQRTRLLWVMAVLLFGPFGALAYVVSELLRGRRFGQAPSEAPVESDPRIAEFEGLLAANPAPALFIELGDLHAQRGDHRSAAEAYGRSLETDPDSLYARYHLGLEFKAQGRNTEAVEELKQVFAADPKYDYRAAAEALADVLLAAGRDREALDQYASVAGASSRARPKFYWGWLVDKAGDAAAAARIMQEIVDEEESVPDYLRSGESPWIDRARRYLDGWPSETLLAPQSK